jgi:hypothetical protein
VKSNLIAITGDNSGDTKDKLCEKGNDVQDCSRAAMCEVLRKTVDSSTTIATEPATTPIVLLCPPYYSSPTSDGQ